jgi:hypothetical protein
MCGGNGLVSAGDANISVPKSLPQINPIICPFKFSTKDW